MKYILDLDQSKFVGPIEKLEKIKGDEVLLSEMLPKLASQMPIETGLMPTSADGVLSIRNGFGYEQIVYQRRPGIYSVKWGYSENDPGAQIYQLAHPWRVIIADFKNGNLLGVRHFYSPDRILNIKQQLYAVNLPNTNTVGYRGTSVGWVCLYHTGNTTNNTLAEKIEYFITRESGFAEPYNDANMSGTDGTRYYKKNKAPEFMWDPVAWQYKSSAEGFEWICDEALLIPIWIKDNDQRAFSHTDQRDNAHPYTLEEAMYGNYSAYYDDNKEVKPINVLVKHGWEDPEAAPTLTAPLRIALGAGVGPKPKKGPPPVEVETLGQALQFLTEQSLNPIPTELHRHILYGYNCGSCGDYITFAENDPITIYKYVSNLAGSEFFQNNVITLTKDHKLAFDDAYRADHAVVVGSMGQWCKPCSLTSSAEVGYWIEGTIKTDEGIKVARLPVRFQLLDLTYDVTAEKMLLKANSSRCPSCWLWTSNLNADDFFVWSETGQDVIGCRKCVVNAAKSISPDSPDSYKWIILGENQPKKMSIKVTDVEPAAASLDSHFVTKSLDDTLCHCGLYVNKNIALKETTEGYTDVCNSCVSPDGSYSCLYLSIELTPEQGQ